jgi:hypothetical protein
MGKAREKSLPYSFEELALIVRRESAARIRALAEHLHSMGDSGPKTVMLEDRAQRRNFTVDLATGKLFGLTLAL